MLLFRLDRLLVELLIETMLIPRLSNTRAAPPMEETKNPPQHGEKPVKTSRLDPGKIEPARRPAPMFRLL